MTSSGRGAGEESDVSSTSLFPPVASSPGQREQKADNWMIRGADQLSNASQASLMLKAQFSLLAFVARLSMHPRSP